MDTVIGEIWRRLPGRHPPGVRRRRIYPELRRQIAVQENTISILLGHNPEDIHRDLPPGHQPHPQRCRPACPPGYWRGVRTSSGRKLP